MSYDNRTNYEISENPINLRNIIMDYTVNDSMILENDELYTIKMRISYICGTLTLIFFCIISIVINIKILMTVGWIRRPLSPTLQISLSLAGADAFSSTALAIGLVMNSFIPRGLGLVLPGVGCFLLSLEAIRLGGVMITVGHLVVLAINHYLGILKPLHYLTIMTHGITMFLIILLWTWPLIFFFAYFGAVENEGFQSRDCATNTFNANYLKFSTKLFSTGIMWLIHPFLRKRKFRVMFSSLFFGPFTIMVFIYAHIFCIVRKHQASRLRYSRAGSSFRRSDNPTTEREEHSASQQMARNVKAINTTLFILGSFVIGWMPAIFLYVLVCNDCLLNFDSISVDAKFIVYNAANCLIILKTLVNPIIYAARMHEIQVATKRMRSSLGGFCDVANCSKDRNRGHSSDAPICHRSVTDLERRASRRLTIKPNQGNENGREKSYKFTYNGNKQFSRNNTYV